MLLLALAGMADAIYFTLAYYGGIKRARWVPGIFCASDGSSCVTVVKTPYARVFGVPNSLLGIIYYAAIIWRVAQGPPVGMRRAEIFLAGRLLALASIVTVALGAYLVYALRRKLAVNCPLCYAAHAINLLLMVLLAASVGWRLD